MFDFLVGKFIRRFVQRAVDRLEPKVAVFIPKELPLPSAWEVKQKCRVVSKINALEEGLERLSDQELKEKTREFKARYQEAVREKKQEFREVEAQLLQSPGDDRDSLEIKLEEKKKSYQAEKQKFLAGILPEAFAVVRAVGQRVLNMRHFDIQMVGGMALHEGKIAEMATGEGKTLVSTLPAYLNAITGEGVHIVTVNDYLARRDREWMGPIFEFLGLSVGVILHDMMPSERKEAYACDITYGTNNEFGFDYLRDNMVNYKEDMVQRPHHYAIVDEVDSILIDEARTPLIISGPAEESTDKYYRANQIVGKLKGRRITESEEIDAKHREEDLTVGFDYIADEKAKSVSLTEAGEEKAAQAFGIDNLHDMDTVEYRHHILQALKAKEFFRGDVDYVVRDGEVIIVDEFTGRLMPGRRWSDGLHQAVEAKEGIKIERENQTLATITFQNYFRMYEKLSGMTGTAYTEANEFKQIYNLDCIVMPTNRVLQRKNHPDMIFKTIKEKFDAVVEEISACHKRGQPVLVGTISIEKSEVVSHMLKQKGIAHEVLNAKYHEREAQIVAQAGRYKAVTIATNMAGRGTDIVLGGNPEFLAKTLHEEDKPEEESLDQSNARMKAFLAKFREQCRQEHELVIEAGGLHVIGTERHESRRIDNQLRGRSGRQGDPGSSRFFLSSEDDLMRLFGGDRMRMIMDRIQMEEGMSIESPMLSRAIEYAQKRVENFNFEIRKQLLEYDNVMNKQREAIYGLRTNILEQDNVKHLIIEAIRESVYPIVDQFLFTGQEEITWDMNGLAVHLKAKFDLDVSSAQEKMTSMKREEVVEFLHQVLIERYEQKEQDISPEPLRHMEKFLLLNTIDAKWKDHLYAMDQLKSGIGLRAYGQRDPVVEFKREGFEMFQMMYLSINQEVAETIFRLRPVERAQVRGIFSSLPQEMVHQDFSSLERGGPQPGTGMPPQGTDQPPPAPQPVRKSGPKVGRNAPCPCGSGKKFKKCCGK